MTESLVREAFARQSAACANLGSPFMARLMTVFAERLTPGDAISDAVLSWPHDPDASASSLPLRLAGALHELKIDGEPDLIKAYPPNVVSDDSLWAAIISVFENRQTKILGGLGLPPQTNEVRRSAVLIPALHMVARAFGRPIELFELGCSAGLNLRADHFAMRANDIRYGPTDAPVVLEPAWRGPAPLPDAPVILRRAGVDLSPLDPSTDRTRLLSYIWPDQAERFHRTEAAATIAADVPAEIDSGDAGDWLTKVLAARPDGKLRFVYHTIAWQYFPPKTVAKAETALAMAGKMADEDAPLVRFSMETGGKAAELSLTVWPGGKTVSLGNCGFHGQWIEWKRVTLDPLGGD
ncbi:MAG: DUF2332 family protein [Pseudomonadota bacterium]